MHSRYKSAEVYQNSSGSETSVSIVAQSTDSSVNHSITVAAASTQYCINPFRCEGHTGTNCYVDTAALTIAGTVEKQNYLSIYFCKWDTYCWIFAQQDIPI